MDLNHSILQLPHIANVFQMPGDDDSKRADAKVLAEVKELPARLLLLERLFPVTTLGFADMGLSLAEGNAIGNREFTRRSEKYAEHQPAERHTYI